MDETLVGLTVVAVVLLGLLTAYLHGLKHSREEHEQQLSAAAEKMLGQCDEIADLEGERDEARRAIVAVQRKMFRVMEAYRKLRRAVRDGETWRYTEEDER